MESNATLLAQQKQRHQRHALIAQTSANKRPSSRQNSRNLALGGKDLIIRMLAEVFQVSQTDEGQVKWQQVSSSLVPVSLYSRTTSKWLNYLLAAPTVNNTTGSAMSPDSRDFLLLLQQFHHQQNNKCTQQSLEQQRTSQIVFQVVAHDYLDGQCKKILNVKLVQPGIRLGQASDYFVYWKDLSNCNTLQSSISFNSNNSLTRLQNPHLYNEQSRNTNHLITTCCGQSFLTQPPSPLTEPQTWGLNFASINDAKLFYDICSLNLVDLDFNSEYLKQLAITNTPQIRNNRAVCQNLLPQTLCGQQNEQKLIRDFLNYKQRQNNQSNAQILNEKLSQQHSSCQVDNNTFKRQQSRSRCPSCKHIPQLNTINNQQERRTEEALTSSSNYNEQCPVHARPQSSHSTRRGQHPTGTLRSRSSTRQTTAILDGSARNQSLKRARSFSTPATPDHKQNNCPHQDSSTDCELHHHKQQVAEVHHPRCASYIKQQQQQKQTGHSTQPRNQLPIDNMRPRKPARGVLRDSASVVNVHHQQFNSTLAKSIHDGSIESSQVLHAKRPIKTRYMGHQSSKEISCVKPKSEKRQVSERESQQSYTCSKDDANQLRKAHSQSQKILHHEAPQKDQLDAARFSQSRSAQRRYTGVDSTELSHFDPLSHHSASLARAQYANSKNMKEFLSLDAGGVLPAPGQLAAINQRFEEQMRAQNATRHCRAPKSVEQAALQSQDRTHSDNQATHLSVGSDINARQILSDSDKRNGLGPFLANPEELDPDNTRHVATTTDDLPLDPLTRSRMFRLTSEEVISERTEPRSCMSIPPIIDQQSQFKGNMGDERQTRAVSLGPELDSELRGRNTRSDTGRRRSLERSTCVDLDPSQTVSSAFRRAYCLSPLTQSVSPMTGGGLESSKNSPSCDVRLEHGHLDALVAEMSGEIAENIIDKHTRFASTPKRARTKSSYCSTTEDTLLVKDNHPIVSSTHSPSFDAMNPKRICAETQNLYSSGMMSFKSAPDVNHYSYDPCRHYNSGHRTTIDSNIAHGQHNHLKIATNKTGSLSSYAVPLCSKVRSDQYGRAFHSCPNSLRRIKRQPHHHCKGQQQLGDARLLAGDLSHHQTCSMRNIQNECSYCAYGRQPISSNLPMQCAIYDEANFAIAFNKSFAQQQKRQHLCQQQNNHHHHHALPACISSISGESTRMGPECFLPCRADCVHSALQYRTCSSLQSCRSPLRYGLYESDEDPDKDGEEPDAAQMAAVERRGQDSSAYHTRLASTCCSTGSSHLPNEELNQPGCNFYFRPLETSSTVPLRPVNDYDKTMARSSLKSRQRARSQPPRETSEATSDTFHLNKSMENVQKLIREVQTELNALKQRPVEYFCQHTPMGTINSQLGSNKLRSRALSSPVRLGDIAHHSTSVKVSNEEENNPKNLLNIDQLPKVSGSSATKGAGQFKSVGAIRKAGFLSVKKWILKRRQTIELARKQGWKRYWVSLRGTALLFHSVVDRKDLDTTGARDSTTNLLAWIQENCSSQPNLLNNIIAEFSDCDEIEKGVMQDNEIALGNLAQCYIEKEPRHLIMIEGAIAQPIPEHPKRDFVFCLSTTFGDAYLFQSSCQLESENWISSIHNACAASIARDLTRDETIKLFETKIRQLELEAERKLFLRQRLDSRLNLMSSFNHISSITNQSATTAKNDWEDPEYSHSNKKVTMRSLLCRLNQQLLALDTHIEQLHCEIYQLRCYLTSCESQNLFYHNNIAQNKIRGSRTVSPSLLSLDLPHPRSLLQNVSKPTKLLLIKLGVFTVSSFHAFVHARQGSAEAILQRGNRKQFDYIRNPSELRVRSQSISGALSLCKAENVELENDTERLIDMANLKVVPVRVDKKLFNHISATGRGYRIAKDSPETFNSTLDGDNGSIHDKGDFLLINLKLHTSSNSLSIVKQVLDIINSELDSFDLLKYCIRLNLSSETKPGTDDGLNKADSNRKSSGQYEVKRNETLNEWSNYDSLELVEKMVFRVNLNRSRLDEDSAPFGVSIGAQLFVNNIDSLLNVYCNYIEWGSVADKAGLKDDDEILMINGVPVRDLDLMFIECIIQDESKLRLVVRSCRSECPSNATLLDSLRWDSSDQGPDGDNGNYNHDESRNTKFPRQPDTNACSGSQIISDEYISSLVCPRPPTKSSAFLRTDHTLLRQKSDLSAEATDKPNKRIDLVVHQPELCCKSLEQSSNITKKVESTSHSNIADLEESCHEEKLSERADFDEMDSISQIVRDSIDPVRETLKENEQLAQLLRKNSVDSLLDHDCPDATGSQKIHEIGESKVHSKKTALNCVERLRKSILELLETEYAYIKHLETICEHYMSPLAEISYLNIPDLKQLDKVIRELLIFQRGFFCKITCGISNVAADLSQRRLSIDDFEHLNEIGQQLNSYVTVEEFSNLLKTTGQIFIEESDNFKTYSAYCAAYSSLQRILHPKISNSTFNHCTFVNPLDTFLHSSGSQSTASNSVLGGGQQHREFLKPFSNSFMPKHSSNGNNETGAQLRQISQFLSQLDSSSSSASSSLPKSTSGSEQTLSGTTNRSKFFKQGSQSHIHQKSVHQQNFESYLIKPIQRIVKYPILLKSIAVSAQFTADAEPYRELQSAIRHMKSITNHVNNTQRIHDEYGLIFDQIRRQYSAESHRANQLSKTNHPTNICSANKPSVSLSIDQLLYFGPVEWINVGEYTSKLKKGMNLTQVLFVFNTCVVFICKELIVKSAKGIKLPISSTCHNLNTTINTDTGSGVIQKTIQKNNPNVNEVIRYQSVIPVSEVQVRSVTVSSHGAPSTLPKEGGSYRWELFRCSSVNSNSNLLTKSSKKNTGGKVYLLASESNEMRNAFLRKIRFIIRESVRNMSLPIARSPSSKSLTPKKLSSPSSGGNTNTNNSSCSHSTSLSPVCNSGDNPKRAEDVVECEFTDGLVNSTNYSTSIEVNN